MPRARAVAARHPRCDGHDIPLNHNLMVRAPRMVAVAHPRAIKRAAAARALAAFPRPWVVVCVAVLAPASEYPGAFGNNEKEVRA